ncbi:hypothetical protein EVAR_83718_1 [Eumeta japonica]|uniref:Uncharacterized protein n=1 Tax=Eumeta variegata TaxID=151549 RepID=A0A4C1WD08_EUMVA|nr:hypothetical protein EVAR_83718_1 [Eumeta japonica]
MPPSTCRLRMRDDRARPRAVLRRHRHDSRNNGSNHCHLIRRGRIPDEKTPGHESERYEGSGSLTRAALAALGRMDSLISSRRRAQLDLREAGHRCVLPGRAVGCPLTSGGRLHARLEL